MQKEIFEGLEKLNHITFNSIMRLGEINARALERLTEHQLKVANAYMESNAKQLQMLGAATGVQDAIVAQSRMVAELNESLVSHAKQTVELLMETKEEFVEWVEDAMKVAKENPLA